MNHGKPYARQVKPFNFLLTARVTPFGRPEGTDPNHFQLIAPYETDPRKWATLPWLNRYARDGECYRISAVPSLYARLGVATVKTYRHVVEEYRAHPEAKSVGREGLPCSRQTVGILRRRPVTTLYVAHVGEESNRLEEVEAGVVHDPEEIYTE
jgi:hypothetical protein